MARGLPSWLFLTVFVALLFATTSKAKGGVMVALFEASSPASYEDTVVPRLVVYDDGTLIVRSAAENSRFFIGKLTAPEMSEWHERVMPLLREPDLHQIYALKAGGGNRELSIYPGGGIHGLSTRITGLTFDGTSPRAEALDQLPVSFQQLVVFAKLWEPHATEPWLGSEYRLALLPYFPQRQSIVTPWAEDWPVPQRQPSVSGTYFRALFPASRLTEMRALVEDSPVLSFAGLTWLPRLCVELPGADAWETTSAQIPFAYADPESAPHESHENPLRGEAIALLVRSLAELPVVSSQIYEGVNPYVSWYLFDSPRRSSAVVRIGEQRFHEDPYSWKGKDLQRFLAILSEASHHGAYTGPKFDDGVHADFAVRWEISGQWRAILGSTSSRAWAFADANGVTWWDMAGDADTQVRELMYRYCKLPPTKEERWKQLRPVPQMPPITRLKIDLVALP